MKKVFISLMAILIATAAQAAIAPEDIVTKLSIKVPGNQSSEYRLFDNKGELQTEGSDVKMPLKITRRLKETRDGTELILKIKANQDTWFRLTQVLSTDYNHTESYFYMPGFWYRQNLRSPRNAPSFHTSDSWTVRDDRLSTPLTGAYNPATESFTTVIRKAKYENDALSTHYEGEIMLSGKTDLGYVGFENQDGKTALCFGFPYQETPHSYVRKLTLAPSVYAFEKLEKGETIELTWEIREGKANDYSSFIKDTWQYCYDSYSPKEVSSPYEVEQMKEVMSNFFVQSYTDKYPLAFYSGEAVRVATCDIVPRAEIGFVGRVLLNAFNAFEYGEQNNRPELVKNAQNIFNTYETNGFSPAGFFNEFVDFGRNHIEPVHSIRRQSEGIYAVLHYLKYERDRGRKHPVWENKIRNMLDQFIKLQNEDGSFPRKFRDDFSLVDSSGGSTPSATLPLVMGYKYFQDERYLRAAKGTANYLENEIISKADYFSSTLDANCEDKEASLYAATATYYLALVSQGEEAKRYKALSSKAAYFAISWYYLYDVPFAQGQMLGDLGFKTRGWGNVSVENNHVDVFIFEFADVLRWLEQEADEKRFGDVADLITSSMGQLLPIEGNLCGIAKKGFYPEVVQHTHWDYGRNGKGYYNDIFAPGWVVASLWELYTPERAEKFLR